MKKIIISLLTLLLIASTATMAQVAISTDNSDPADASAILDLKSTDKGLLVPRMTTAERNAIVSPASGLVIFNTNSNCFNFFLVSDWFELCGKNVGAPATNGSTFSNFSNSVSENFSENISCQNKIISAGHNPESCSGTVTTPNATYDVVLINGQCWMQTNLKEPSTAPCGDPINTGCNTWLNTNPGDIGSWGYYNTITTNGTAGWGTTDPASGEGLLYQWSAVMNGSNIERAQGVCPPGWHIPSDCEWMYLEHGQGMSIAQQNTFDAYRSTSGEGDKLKESGSNSSGFTALFSGMRNTTGLFSNRGLLGYWWSSSEYPGNFAIRRTLGSPEGVMRQYSNRNFGWSVRCLKD